MEMKQAIPMAGCKSLLLMFAAVLLPLFPCEMNYTSVKKALVYTPRRVRRFVCLSSYSFSSPSSRWGFHTAVPDFFTLWRGELSLTAVCLGI